MFFDIGVGLLLASIVGAFTKQEPSQIFLAVGVAGCLLPDIDFLVWIMRGKKLDHLAHKHRDLLHRPLVLTPILTGCVWGFLGWQAGVLFGIATLAHFMHDSIGHGWGIKWFWPLDNQYWCYRSLADGPMQLNGWTEEEQCSMCDVLGDRDWMKQLYGGFTRSLIVELIVMAAGIASTVLWYSVPTY